LVVCPNNGCDPVTRAARVGCVREIAGPMTAGWRPGTTTARRPRRAAFGSAVTTFSDRLQRAWRRVRGATGEGMGTLDDRIPKDPCSGASVMRAKWPRTLTE